MNSSSSAAFRLDDDNPGDWVARQCADLGVPIARIAAQAGVNRATIWRWRSGVEPGWGSFNRVRNVIRSHWSQIERDAETSRSPWPRQR